MKLRDGWRFRGWAVAVALLLAGGAAMAAAETSETAAVLGKLHHANQMEIEMGRLAMQRGEMIGVTSFGQTLIVDHTAVDERVVALAKRERIDVTAAMPAMTGDSMAKLRTLKGMQFDKAFARAMLEDHTQDVDEAKAVRDKTSDGQLKALLVTTIPVLEKHRDMAQKLADTIGPGTAPNTAGANMPGKK